MSSLTLLIFGEVTIGRLTEQNPGFGATLSAMYLSLASIPPHSIPLDVYSLWKMHQRHALAISRQPGLECQP